MTEAAVTAERPFTVDPDTAALASKGVTKYPSAARLRAALSAKSVDRPLTPKELRDEGRRIAFVDAVISIQAGARTVAAPFFDFRNGEDEQLWDRWSRHSG